MITEREAAMITVCDACRMQACWDGIFMCSDAYRAGIMEIPAECEGKLS